MAAVQKRRATNRSKTQKAAKVTDQVAKGLLRPRPWVQEVSTLGLLAGGIVLLLSLSSYFYLFLSNGLPSPSRNIMGPVGHVVATLLVGSIGIVSLLPVAALLYLAFFRKKSNDSSPKRYHAALVGLAGVCLIFGLASLLALVGPRVNLSSSLGGTVGSSMVGVLVRSSGWGGAGFIAVLVCAVALAIILQRSVGEVALGLQWLVRRGTKVTLVTTPTMAFRTVALAAEGAAQVTGIAVRKVGTLAFRRILPGSVDSTRTKAAPVEPPLPKPRVRKNLFPKSESVAIEAKEPSSKADSTESVVGRSEPIIVKPRAQEAGDSDLVVLKGALAAKRGAKAATTSAAMDRVVTNSYDDYVPPDIKFLTRAEEHENSEDDEELRQKAEQIEAKLRDFNIAGRVTQVHPGPVITLFEFEPAAGVKVGRIAALQDDLAMSLKASSIRIIAPIPKRGTVGIEVPNKHQAMVRLRDCLESEAFRSGESTLSVPLGKDTYGDAVVVDIATMPHLLMAGATGTGKSVSINALLLSLLYRAHPSELGLILIDPKVLELSIYDGIPHLRVPVVTDPRQAKAVLSWAVKEMDRRYRYMQKFGVRNIDGYNQVVAGESAPQVPIGKDAQLALMPEDRLDERLEDQVEAIEGEGDDLGKMVVEPVAPEQLKPMPKLVIVIDELADLMLTVGREIEELITRLAQKARAAGIHLIVATQRPSVDVITGLIKANFPARLSFRVSSRIDSRTILDSMGAEKLLGKGDMLFMLPGAVPLKRIHGAFVSDGEVQKVVAALKAQCPPQYDENIIAACDKALREETSGGEGGEGGGGDPDEYDPFYDKAVELVLEKGQASTSMVQRTFRIGYNRAARIIEMMEREGIVGKMDGVKPREILLPPTQRSPGA